MKEKHSTIKKATSLKVSKKNLGLNKKGKIIFVEFIKVDKSYLILDQRNLLKIRKKNLKLYNINVKLGYIIYY